MRGARSIYVDYVDYDEIAHHAGSTRIESLAALTGLDQVLAVLEKVADRAPRRYHFVLLSDHGQSQGQPFAERWGTDLSELCAALTRAETTGIEDSVEGWGRVDSVVEDLARGRRRLWGAAGREPSPGAAGWGLRRQEDGDTLVVLGSGNLGLVYVPGPQRLSLDEIEARWPQLIPGLVGARGHRLRGRAGRRRPGRLRGGQAGTTWRPGSSRARTRSSRFGTHAAGDAAHGGVDASRRRSSTSTAPWIPVTGDVAAFEPLVGCHGGLGGWQDRAFVMAPPDLLDTVGTHPGWRRAAPAPCRDPADAGAPHTAREEHGMTLTHTSRLLVTAAAAVVVIAGIKAASDIVGPLVLALALTIVFHPMRARLDSRLPSWAASVVVLVCAYALVLALIVSLVVALGQLAVLVPSYASEIDDYVQDVGGWFDRRRDGERPGRCRDGCRRHRQAGGPGDGHPVRCPGPALEPVLPRRADAVPRLRRLQVPGAGRRGASGAPGVRRRHDVVRARHAQLSRGVGGLRPDRRGDRHRRALRTGGAGGVRLGGAGVRHQLHPQHRLRDRPGASGRHRPVGGRSRADARGDRSSTAWSTW